MVIVELKKENHIFVCMPLLVLLPGPVAAAATAAAGASAGGGWDIGDGCADASFMCAHMHIEQPISSLGKR